VTQSQATRPAPEPAVQRSEAGRPGVAAPAKPSLSRDWLDQWTAHTEWLLDIHLTDAQRRECQDLWMRRWQETDPSGQERFRAGAKAELQWAKDVAGRSAAERAELRAQRQPLVLAGLRESSDLDERLLVSLHDAAHKPGSDQNPTLVAGTPPLTQGVVDTWRRFSEWALDVQLTEQQRQQYRRLFVKEWRGAHRPAKEVLLKAAAEGLPAQLVLLDNGTRDLLRDQLQSQLLDGLESSAETELSAWLLTIYESVHWPDGEGSPGRSSDR
jgi:hypothetical protein